MKRFLLINEKRRFLLPERETVVGRALSCGVRFDDPTLSREHLRIIVVKGKAAAANLSKNGSLLNGTRLDEPRQLQAGDQLRLGFQRIWIEVVEADDAVAAPARASGAIGDPHDELDDERTRPGDDEWPWAEPGIGDVAAGDETADSLVKRLKKGDGPVHTCPRCRSQLSPFDDSCPRCSYELPDGHPSSVTQRIPVQIRTRKEHRYAVEVPVTYSSATVTIDAVMRDVSRGGVFIATEMLDATGTSCVVTARPEGHLPVRFSGLVAHVSIDHAAGRVGLGIQFVDISPGAAEWLESMLTGHVLPVT